MYSSSINISTENKKQLINKMNIFLKANKFIYCKALKRKIELSKLPEAIINRKDSATARLKRFFVAINILKWEKEYKKRFNNNCFEYEIIWFDKNWVRVYIHLREKNNRYKDKILYFISCY